ncbi:class I SAM-dependent methyltransferase [Saccharopolyspora sp. K220]|nr:class I SAM-dependent methyltransferase [Saccharopolyspora soli]
MLEIGAGPGRFTRVLAGLGCAIVVTDFSRVQLDLNAQHVAATDAEQYVQRRELLDICDTGRYGSGEFDAVVAYGGPLSYAFDHALGAVRGLLRIVKPGGVVLASVMSTVGTWRHLLPAITGWAEVHGEDANDAILRTGDFRQAMTDQHAHVCRMFRWSEISTLARDAGGVVLDGSASNWASLADPEVLARIEADPDRWRRFLDHEEDACRQPGARDGGTHTLIAVQPAPPRRQDAMAVNADA